MVFMSNLVAEEFKEWRMAEQWQSMEFMVLWTHVGFTAPACSQCSLTVNIYCFSVL